MASDNEKKKNRTRNIILVSVFSILSIIIFFSIFFIEDKNKYYWVILILLILLSFSLSIFISELFILIWVSFNNNNKVNTDFTSNFMGIFVIILPLIIFTYYFNY